MLPASNKGIGMNMGFPDVCLTPAAPVPIPIPYPNMGMHAMAVPFCPTILLSMVPALNQGSIIPMTLCDQPGVANPLFMQMGMFTMGSPKVILQGMPAITVSCPTTGNNMNNPVGLVAVPSVTNVLYTYAGEPGEAPSAAPVTWELAAEGVGHVAIRVFSVGVPALVHTAIERLARLGLARIVLDLRDNPGGEMIAAIELARDLLPRGVVVATIEDADGDIVTYRARGDAYPYPFTVRVNGGTASAAELLAGALQAHGRAHIVGERTYGKSAVRALLGGSFADAGRFRLPDGRDIGGTGITPDVEGGPYFLNFE
jgi:carboxyl-terminal processing protease